SRRQKPKKGTIDNLQHALRNLFYFNQTASAIPGVIQRQRNASHHQPTNKASGISHFMSFDSSACLPGIAQTDTAAKALTCRVRSSIDLIAIAPQGTLVAYVPV